MNDDRKINTAKRNIIGVLLCVLAAAALGALYYTNRQQERTETAALEALQEEAEPYETELRRLRSELSTLESNISYSGEEAGIMVGFVPSDVSDLSYIAEKAEAYAFTPVLVLDCTMEAETLEAIISAADRDWEIMLCASGFSEDSNEEVVSVISYLEEADRADTGIFFLRADDCNEDNIGRLVQDGFVGYTSYHDSPTAGQTEEGLVYFDYSYLTAAGTSVTTRLASLYYSKAAMIVVFDMASIDSGALYENYVTSLFDTLKTYTDEEDCSFITVADAVAELSAVNSIEADNQAAYEERAAEIQERIGELKEILAEIYDRAE